MDIMVFSQEILMNSSKHDLGLKKQQLTDFPKAGWDLLLPRHENQFTDCCHKQDRGDRARQSMDSMTHRNTPTNVLQSCC